MPKIYRLNYRYNYRYNNESNESNSRLTHSAIHFKRKPKKHFSATLLIVILNVVFFIVATILSSHYGDIILKNIAVQPLFILHGEKLWTIVTSMFMHGGFLHLFVNMVSLIFLGSFLERLIGTKRFLLIYFISGIVASLAFVFLALAFHSNLEIPAVGASGAIFGIAGVLAVITPKLPVYIMFIPIAMPMWLGIVLMLALLWLISIAAGLPIGNTAHLGGFLAGLAYGFYLRLKHKRKVALLDKYFR